jgi:hypothetical protein
MHPLYMSPYGMYMTDVEEGVPFIIDISGFSGMIATRLLGETWEDDYVGYCYEEGDEAYVEMLVFYDGDDFEDEFDIYLDEEDEGYTEQGY